MSTPTNEMVYRWRKNNHKRYSDYNRTYQREYARRIRESVINHYGGVCVCCDEKEHSFLCIDHINGGGRKHKMEIKGMDINRWLKKNGYPDGFQILCFNCNNAKSIHGYCPHNPRRKI